MTIPKHVNDDLANGFIMTDIDDGFQRMKQVNETTFTYRCELNGDTFEETIDVDTIDKEEAISGYYGSVGEVVAEYGESANMIIAECEFEAICSS